MVLALFGHVLPPLFLHGEKPGSLLCGAVVECTNMSLRFLSLQKATIGGSGMAFLHLSGRCSTERRSRGMLKMFRSADEDQGNPFYLRVFVLASL